MTAGASSLTLAVCAVAQLVGAGCSNKRAVVHDAASSLPASADASPGAPGFVGTNVIDGTVTLFKSPTGDYGCSLTQGDARLLTLFVFRDVSPPYMRQSTPLLIVKVRIASAHRAPSRLELSPGLPVQFAGVAYRLGVLSIGVAERGMLSVTVDSAGRETISLDAQVAYKETVTQGRLLPRRVIRLSVDGVPVNPGRRATMRCPACPDSQFVFEGPPEHPGFTSMRERPDFDLCVPSTFPSPLPRPFVQGCGEGYVQFEGRCMTPEQFHRLRAVP